MAASQPQPGTSSGVRHPLNPILDLEVDATLLEDDLPGLGRVLTLNNLKLVDEDYRNKLLNASDEHNTTKQLKCANAMLSRKVTDLETKNERFENTISVQRTKESKMAADIKGLQRELQESKKTLEKLQLDMSNQHNFFEEIQQQSQTEIQKLKRSSSESEQKCLEAERKVQSLETQVEETNNKVLMMQAVIRQREEEMSKGQNRIAAEKDEKDRLVRERCRVIGFIRKVNKFCNLFNEKDDDLLISQGSLEQLAARFEQYLNDKNNEKRELERNREIVGQIKELADALISVPPEHSSGTTSGGSRTSELNQQAVSDCVAGEIIPPTSPQTINPSSPHSSTVVSSSLEITPPESPEEGEDKNQNRFKEDDFPVLLSLPSIIIPTEARITVNTAQSIPLPYTQAPSSIVPAACVPPPSESTLSYARIARESCIPPPAPDNSPPVVPTPTSSPRQQPKSSLKRKRTSPTKNQRYHRSSKQSSPFANTTKPHGVNRACAGFRCLCGNPYQNQKGLTAHVGKMTKEWKYRCNKCAQYFFYQYDLTRHCKDSKCNENNTDIRENVNLSPQLDGNGIFNDSFDLDDILADVAHSQAQPPIHQPPEQASSSTRVKPSTASSSMPTVATVCVSAKPSTSVEVPLRSPCAPQHPPASSSPAHGPPLYRPGTGKSTRAETKKLQEQFFKRKKHVPWLSKLGAVQGSWYCTCGNKYSSKTNLLFHTQYWSMEWKFPCGQCQKKYFCLSYLKKHLMTSHKIHEPLKQFVVGCNLCGEMFQRKTQYYHHRKTRHNLHPPRRSRPTNTEDILIVSVRSLAETTPGAISNVTGSTLSTPPPCIDIDSDNDEGMCSPLPSAVSSPSTDTAYIQRLRPRRQRNQSRQPHGLVGQAQSSNENENCSRGYLCECGKTYKSVTALMLHVRSEKDGEIFGCPICPRAFRQLVNLKSHMASIHLDRYKGFRCAHCGNADTSVFVNIKAFRSHCSYVHGHSKKQ